MNRDQAFNLLKKYLKEEANLNHSLESEAIMRVLGRNSGEDEARWGIIGLLHDIDWELTQYNPASHGVEAAKILKEASVDEDIIQAIVSHTYGTECGGNMDKKRNTRLEHLLAAAETITGLIFACALVHPEKKLSSVQVKSVKKKFKDKSFAAKVNREIIKECELAGYNLDEFIDLSLKAMQGISGQIGL